MYSLWLVMSVSCCNDHDDDDDDRAAAAVPAPAPLFAYMHVPHHNSILFSTHTCACACMQTTLHMVLLFICLFVCLWSDVVWELSCDSNNNCGANFFTSHSFRLSRNRSVSISATLVIIFSYHTCNIHLSVDVMWCDVIWFWLNQFHHSFCKQQRNWMLDMESGFYQPLKISCWCRQKKSSVRIYQAVM